MLASTLQSRGGKARAAALSPARRAEIAKKAAAARWKAFDAGYQAGERLAENFINAGVIAGSMFSAGVISRTAVESSAIQIVTSTDDRDMDIVDRGAQQPEALAGAVGLRGSVVKVEPAKPKRPLPKAGTVSALVLDVLRGDGPNESVDIAKELYYSAKINVRNTTEAYEQVKNALSSLRSAGHVVSEPKPGSRREKLWRLA